MPTKINYVDVSWNPVTGCTPISEGCKNCYAHRMSKRLAGRAGYPADDPFRVTLHPDRMFQPYRWKKPRRVFVCSMSDLFHKDIPFEAIWIIYDTMSGAAQIKGHTFIVLTKRPERALKFYEWVKQGLEDNLRLGKMVISWPIPNLWLGITAENQEMFDKRWAYLKQIPAAVYMISYEPALGPLVLPPDFLALGNRAFLVCGGESGPGARPMHPDWPRKVRDDCVAAGVPFFFKQWGEWGPRFPGVSCAYNNMVVFNEADNGHEPMYLKGMAQERQESWFDAIVPDDTWMYKVGKKAAGRQLDGQVWDQLPGRV